MKNNDDKATAFLRGQNVYALDWMSFDNMCSERNITDETVESWNNQAFIEIHSESDKDKFTFKRSHSNVLHLVFDDVMEDQPYEDLEGNKLGPNFVTISDEQAKQLADFITLHKERNFLIHCHAGISRSGATAQAICELKDIPLETFRVMNPYAHPNGTVLRKLRALLTK